MDKQREKFEAWADSKGLLPHARAARWDGWQAALAASQICVAKPELPVKTWRERAEETEFDSLTAADCLALADKEIKDLRAALSASGQPAQAAMLEDYVMMPRCLTAKNGAKGLLSGEFKETINMPCPECHDQDGDYVCETCENFGEVQRDIPVSWDTIKHIYAMAIEHLAASPAPQPSQVAMNKPAIDLKMLAMELRGVIVDTEQGHGFDAVCLETVKRIHDALAQNAGQEKSDRDGHFAAIHAALLSADQSLVHLLRGKNTAKEAASLNQARCALSAATNRIERLPIDADRYDYLREHFADWVVKPERFDYKMSEFDAAIDAAMSTTGNAAIGEKGNG